MAWFKATWPVSLSKVVRGLNGPDLKWVPNIYMYMIYNPIINLDHLKAVRDGFRMGQTALKPARQLPNGSAGLKTIPAVFKSFRWSARWFKPTQQSSSNTIPCLEINFTMLQMIYWDGIEVKADLPLLPWAITIHAHNS